MWLGCDSWRVPPTQFSSAFMRLLVPVYYVNELAQKKKVTVEGPPTQFSSLFMRVLFLVYYVNELAQKAPNEVSHFFLGVFPLPLFPSFSYFRRIWSYFYSLL